MRATIQRTGDVVARFGGEEFILLLPNTDAKNAEIITNQLREAIGSTSITVEQQTLQIHASIGVATTIPNHNEHDQKLLKEADLALYRAKEKCRNRVEVISC